MYVWAGDWIYEWMWTITYICLLLKWIKNKNWKEQASQKNNDENRTTSEQIEILLRLDRSVILLYTMSNNAYLFTFASSLDNLMIKMSHFQSETVFNKSIMIRSNHLSFFWSRSMHMMKHQMILHCNWHLLNLSWPHIGNQSPDTIRYCFWCLSSWDLFHWFDSSSLDRHLAIYSHMYMV